MFLWFFTNNILGCPSCLDLLPKVELTRKQREEIERRGGFFSDPSPGWQRGSIGSLQSLCTRSHKTGCRTWRLGVPSYSTHWMGPNTTPLTPGKGLNRFCFFFSSPKQTLLGVSVRPVVSSVSSITKASTVLDDLFWGNRHNRHITCPTMFFRLDETHRRNPTPSKSPGTASSEAGGAAALRGAAQGGRWAARRRAAVP